MSVLSKERSTVDLVNSPAVVSVHRSESGIGRVVKLQLELPLEGLESSLQVNLLLEDGAKSKLNVSGKILHPSNVSGRPV